MAPTTINQTDRDYVARVLLPGLLRVIEPYTARLDALGVGLGPRHDGLYGSFREFHAAVIDELSEYAPRHTPTGYDLAWSSLTTAVNRIAWAVANKHHELGLSMQPDRYAEAMATIRILPGGDTYEPAVKLLDVLRAADELPAILAEIHQYAASRAYSDWSIPVPPSPDYFHRRRYTAYLPDDRRVLIYATGTPASRLIWRVYADHYGREYLGLLATMGVSGWERVTDPERGGTLIPESQLGRTERGVQISQIVDITLPCDDFEYDRLLASVKTYVFSRHTDGHLSESEAWDMAVTMPAMMAGIVITRSDLRRALAEAGWTQTRTYGHWY